MQKSAVSKEPEMAGNESYIVANNLKIAYDEFGDRDNPVILLVMGLGTQMIAWPDDFCLGLAEQGYRVIRFDNRDIGLSEKIEVKRPVSIPALILKARVGLSVKTPYTLEDMAKDTIGVLDALDIESAHVVGASMGGMIAQIVTALYPERVLSLTSIMSTTGNPKLPGASWRAARQLLTAPASSSEKDLVAHQVKTRFIIGSPDFRPTYEEMHERVLRSVRRSVYREGYRNQMAAIIRNGDRRELLATISTPTLVIHGREDVLVPVPGGIDTANCIEGAELRIFEGMGHDLPRQLIPRFVRLIDGHARKATAG